MPPLEAYAYPAAALGFTALLLGAGRPPAAPAGPTLPLPFLETGPLTACGRAALPAAAAPVADDLLLEFAEAEPDAPAA